MITEKLGCHWREEAAWPKPGFKWGQFVCGGQDRDWRLEISSENTKSKASWESPLLTCRNLRYVPGDSFLIKIILWIFRPLLIQKFYNFQTARMVIEKLAWERD